MYIRCPQCGSILLTVNEEGDQECHNCGSVLYKELDIENLLSSIEKERPGKSLISDNTVSNNTEIPDIKCPLLTPKAKRRRWSRSPAGKASAERYRRSELYKIAHEKHRRTLKYKLTQKRFWDKQKIIKAVVKELLGEKKKEVEYNCPLKIMTSDCGNDLSRCDYDGVDSCNFGCIGKTEEELKSLMEEKEERS